MLGEPLDLEGSIQDAPDGPGEQNARGGVLVCVLGEFRLLHNGRPINLRRKGKTETLLEQLALAGKRAMSREEIICALWPDAEPTLARQAFKSLLHTLRQLFGQALDGLSPVVHSAGHYRLNHEAGVRGDIAAFDSLAAAGDRAARAGDATAAVELYRRASALYRGDLNTMHNEGVHAILERERLRAVQLTLLVRLADYAFERADYDGCLAYATRLLLADAGREDAHRLVMRCYVRRGERAQALRHYQTARGILRAELGVVPEPATVALFRQVRLDPAGV
jgi:DNA-binding SARP family transcriptional activator